MQLNKRNSVEGRRASVSLRSRFAWSAHQADQSWHGCAAVVTFVPSALPLLFPCPPHSHPCPPSLLGKVCMTQNAGSDGPVPPFFFLTWSPSQSASSGD